MSAFSHPGFRAYFLAAVPLVQALWAQRVTLGWLAWEASGSAAFVGLVAALTLAPMLISGPVFGVLVDRTDIRRAIRTTSGAMAMLMVVAALLAGGPGLSQAMLVTLALAIGVVSSAHHPVRMSLAPRLVPVGEVQSVVALTALNFNLARLVAPALAGLALASVGPVATLWAAAALYVPMLVAVRWMAPRPLPVTGTRGSIREGLRDAARFIWVTPVARQAIVLTAVMAVLVRGYLELLPVMAEGIHGRGAEGLGLLTASAGAGALLAALAKTAGHGQVRDGVPGLMRVILVIGVLGLAPLGLVEAWWAAMVWTALAGFSSTFCGVTLQAMVQMELPDDLRGRVMSLWVVVGIGAVALGSGGLGWLAGLFGLPAVLVGAGLAGGAVTAAMVLPSRSGRPT
ncbi:MFS transporter [Jannaschia seohaensis]|uniref:Predicted arabinose efflux permease, MFS family n=1 Tax=Jannaschia seohaensis TaxID=475081 RepID=A0A2Y9B243_9RHOB|nr:MFS transporter [Jannaschia seohaensis]PWJ13274.1 putative MFS family arabinose efflux permease [Jannaschia seohaensis]SSA50600.1 Predicted arabinose efflux permease, MFS family [Jannaschia seohaensis]